MEALEALENMEQADETCEETEQVKGKEESHGNEKQKGGNHDSNEAPEERLVNSRKDSTDIMETESVPFRNDKEPMVEEQETNTAKEEDDALEDKKITEMKIGESNSEEEEETINNLPTNSGDNFMLEGSKLKVIVGGELISDPTEIDTAPVDKAPTLSPTSESKGWECKECTFVNPERARKCKMCGTKKR